jgi:hypothetical protein
MERPPLEPVVVGVDELVLSSITGAKIHVYSGRGALSTTAFAIASTAPTPIESSAAEVIQASWAR